MAAAHDVGVLHRDIKPSNVLVEGEGECLITRLIDFGSGRLTEMAETMAVTVAGLGLTADVALHGNRISGTLRYMAPEILAGGPPTIAADIYALGVLLYQMIVGDLNRPLTVWCEADINDPLLRLDVVKTVARRPELRLTSAALLADNLYRLDERRIEAARQNRLEAETKYLAYRMDRARLRRPWLIVAAASLILGFAGTTLSAIRAARERDEALRQSATALAVNQFLTDDLLGRGNPLVSGKSDETLMQAAEAAEPMIEQRLSHQPMLAASIYVTLTRAFEERGAFAAARHAFDRAQAILTQAEGAGSADVLILRLRRAAMEATATDLGSLAKSQKIIAEISPLVTQLGDRKTETRAWLLWARGQVQLTQGGMAEARSEYQEAATLAETLPQAFDSQTRFSIWSQYGFSLMKLGQWNDAETVFIRLADEQTLLHGALHPNVLLSRLNLAEVALLSNHPSLAVTRVDAVYPGFREIFGPSGRKTLQALSVRVAASLSLGRYDDTERDAMEIYREAVLTQGKTSFFAFSELGFAGDSECRSGRTKDGTLKLEEVYETSKSSLGNTNPVTDTVRATLAECLVLDGRPLDADPLLAHIDCKALAGLTGQPDYCGDADVLHAAIAVKFGDIKHAIELLIDAQKYFKVSVSDPYYKQWADKLQLSLASQTAR